MGLRVKWIEEKLLRERNVEGDILRSRRRGKREKGLWSEVMELH